MTEKVKQLAAPVTGSDEIDIGRLVGTVIEARWWVLGITAVFALCAVIYTLFATPPSIGRGLCWWGSAAILI